MHRVLICTAGLLGASGVAAAAASSHAAASLLGPYALIALTHAPALLALGLLANTRLMAIAGGLLAAGAILFCGDLAMRHFVGHGLFPYSAPMGGVTLIIGWIGVFASGLISIKSRNNTPE